MSFSGSQHLALWTGTRQSSFVSWQQFRKNEPEFITLALLHQHCFFLLAHRILLAYSPLKATYIEAIFSISLTLRNSDKWISNGLTNGYQDFMVSIRKQQYFYKFCSILRDYLLSVYATNQHLIDLRFKFFFFLSFYLMYSVTSFSWCICAICSVFSSLSNLAPSFGLYFSLASPLPLQSYAQYN